MKRKHRIKRRTTTSSKHASRIRRSPRDGRIFVARTKRQADVLDRVLAAVSLSRREHLDLRAAAKIEGTRVSTIRRYAPSAIVKRGGKYQVKTLDHIPRVLNVVGAKGMQTIPVLSSRSASKVARYMNAVRKLIYKNDPSGLGAFRRKKVAGYKFITNVAKLKQLADAGLLSLDRLYAGVTRGR